ncbi:MAG TPA: UDP-N-acetylmuramate dehydrogenase, partial [Sphaerochaeta sp.]|nr:UDP-N-acetylmuramate dehydrogenase [Sphaerochaeta sp.]
LDQVRIQGSLLIAQSGAAMDQVVKAAIDAGFGGLEELAGLPGTVGGAVFGNSGANGKAVADLLYWTEYLDSEAKLYRKPAHRSAFGYRHSPFVQHGDHLITEVAFALTPLAQKGEAMRRIEGYKAARNKKGHFRYPSLGSIFKNPSQEQSAGALIESLGLKGTSIGGASISEAHANFIINPHRTATSSDVQALIALIKEQVVAATGVLLEEEINYLGQW